MNKKKIDFYNNPIVFVYSLAIFINNNKFKKIFRRKRIVPIFHCDLDFIVDSKTDIENKVIFDEEKSNINIEQNKVVQDEVLTNMQHESTENAVSPLAQYGEITGNNVRLRKTPSLSGTVIRQLHKGYLVSVSYEPQRRADGHTWQYVGYNGAWGWVSVNYLHGYS